MVAIAVYIVAPDTNDYKNIAAPQAAEGLTLFAMFFTVALAIERIVEPITKIFTAKDTVHGTIKELEVKRNALLGALDTTQGGQGKVTVDEVNKTSDDAATTKDVLTLIEALRSTWFWTIATVIAIIFTDYMGLYLLKTVGVSNKNAWLDVLATGLVIGAGTAPLHGLVERITAKKA